MKKINLLLTLFLIVSLFTNCNQNSDLPVGFFDDLEKGAFPRLLNFEGSFYLTDVENSSVSWEVEFYDEDNGAHVTEYNWTVQYISRNSAGVPLEETIMTSILKPEFEIQPESGLPSISRTWTFEDVLDAFGMEPSDIIEDDEFNFFATLKRDDGKEFNTVNTGDNIESYAPFNGFFRFTMEVQCKSELEGNVNVVGTGWCGNTIGNDSNDIYQIEFIHEGDGIYKIKNGDYSFGAYYACYGIVQLADPDEITLRIQDRCNRLSFTGEYKFGEKFQFNEIIVDGSDLFIDWNNDAVPEAGTAILTRVDGKNWPPLRL